MEKKINSETKIEVNETNNDESKNILNYSFEDLDINDTLLRGIY